MLKERNRIYVLLVMVIALVFMREVNASEAIKNIDIPPATASQLEFEKAANELGDYVLEGFEISFAKHVNSERRLHLIEARETLTLGLSLLAVFVSLIAMVTVINLKRKG